MNLSLDHLADKFVFWNLNKISYGYLELIDSKGQKHFFGDKESSLKANIKINDPSFMIKLLSISRVQFLIKKIVVI